MNEDILRQAKELYDNKKLRRKIISFLCKNYSQSQDDAEDIYQDACIVLYMNIKERRLVKLTSRLTTYFFQICIFQVLKKVRDIKTTNEFDPDRVDYLAELDDGFSIDQQQAMETLIKSLPTPCNEILWSYYYDNQSMEEIAQMIKFRSADSVKTKKSRCMSELRRTYQEKIKELMYGTN